MDRWRRSFQRQQAAFHAGITTEDRSDTRRGKKPLLDGDPIGAPATAFDLWLTRGLHKLYDDIAAEPLPDALLKIIEEDRGKT